MSREYATAIPGGDVPWDLEPDTFEAGRAHVEECDEGCRLYAREIGTDEWIEVPAHQNGSGDG